MFGQNVCCQSAGSKDRNTLAYPGLNRTGNHRYSSGLNSVSLAIPLGLRIAVLARRSHVGAHQKYRGVTLAYRNKTYVAFASEDIGRYRLMEAWRDNEKIDFNFYDAHDLYISRDTSKPETIKKNLRSRLGNAKQVVLLGSKDAKRKGDDGVSFLAHEIEVIKELELPIVVANLDGDRKVDRAFIPNLLLDANYYTLSTSFQPKIIMYALDNYPAYFAGNMSKGPHQYPASKYEELGL